MRDFFKDCLLFLLTFFNCISIYSMHRKDESADADQMRRDLVEFREISDVQNMDSEAAVASAYEIMLKKMEGILSKSNKLFELGNPASIIGAYREMHKLGRADVSRNDGAVNAAFDAGGTAEKFEPESSEAASENKAETVADTAYTESQLNNMDKFLRSIGIQIDRSREDCASVIVSKYFENQNSNKPIEIQGKAGILETRKYTAPDGQVFNIVNASAAGKNACGFHAIDANVSRGRANDLRSRNELLNSVLNILKENSDAGQVSMILGYLTFDAKLRLDKYLDENMSLKMDLPPQQREEARNKAVSYISGLIAHMNDGSGYELEFNVDCFGRTIGLMDVLAGVQNANAAVVEGRGGVNRGKIVHQSPKKYDKCIYVLYVGGHYMRLEPAK